ncbi:hypothetical protein GO499_05845 [Algicella marina]|uniref:PRC-barrel domain-containing protein n=2 Tax=Algicella marina TaxID=2683284 RepID=A0A6P1T2Y6_9RHOB|nr:hypothetical protein GO499_05845 [Algicella marina]
MADDTGIFARDDAMGVETPETGFYEADNSMLTANNFINAMIYPSADDNASSIGDVNDIVLTQDGRVAAVIVGVGGFLGIGEKDVAVSMDKLEWRVNENQERQLVASVTREQLEAAPEFDRSVIGTDGEVPSEDVVQ